MIKVSEKAGLFNRNTDRAYLLALKVEAASLYYIYDKFFDYNYIIPEKTYIVCDSGGGTGDFVTHYKESENKIEEKYQPIGGPFGSEEIDKEFFNLIFKE